MAKQGELAKGGEDLGDVPGPQLQCPAFESQGLQD